MVGFIAMSATDFSIFKNIYIFQFLKPDSNVVNAVVNTIVYAFLNSEN